ncbi:TPA: hypothetical protein N0F65_012211 [Lagenidium giganteum]|uniref:Endonuclease/exonuclease/phosphatase domain-containing protein n=1 Tax=Lagenidium giganteum TaxID=4803 RepID=A0AAV2ZC81_9STRA|nr:TPA: hypothetical protein N0F65_012211 [Lagenidium giganteum]
MVNPVGNARPLAMCVGMGVALLLSSVSMTRQNRALWRSWQTLAQHPMRRGIATARAEGAMERYRPRFLSCQAQLEQAGREQLSKKSITVVQFNILARNLATRNHFPYVIETSLNWENRKMTLLRQLEALDADIVCLEELSDYWTFFKPELSERGYDSVFVKRPSLNVSNWSGEKKHDGCGIFYKKNKFELKECESVNFHDAHDRVAILALLKLRDFSQFVLVGCTHLWWNAKKVEHQMAELFELEEEVIRMSSDVKDKYERDLEGTVTGRGNLPIILCGDFNNSPDSAIYEYLHRSFMQEPNIEGVSERFRSAYAKYKYNRRQYRLANPTANDDEEEEEEEGSEEQDSNSIEAQHGEPPHTTVNFRRCWTIDYIWYSSSTIVPRQVLEIPSERILRSEEGPPDWFNRLAMSDSYSKLGRLPSGLHGNHNGIPNSQFGSDHVPIMAEFEFLKSRSEDKH